MLSNDFTKEELIEISEYCNAWESGVGMSDFRTNLWHKIQSMIDNYCEHSYGICYEGEQAKPICLKCRRTIY